MAAQPLSLQWLCFIRDHGTDLKLSKEARVLASVLPTYGEGKKIFATMVTLSRVTGMKRETVRNARRELQDKGLLEDITGDHDKQERTYRLTVPGYVSPKVVPERTTPGPQEDHPVVPERTTPGPQEDHNIKQLDQEVDQAEHHHGPDDDGCQLPSEENPTPGKNTDWVDWDDPDDGGCIAEGLGVPVASIGKPFRAWIDGLLRSGEMDLYGEDYLAFDRAVQDSHGKQKPVGYLKSILPGYVAELRSIGKQAFYDKHRAA